MHSVADTPPAGAVTPVTAGLDAVPDVTTTAAACVCIHRKRTLDTLRQRLARRLKRARRHRHDVIDAESTGDDVSDDVDTSTGEPILYGGQVCCIVTHKCVTELLFKVHNCIKYLLIVTLISQYRTQQ